MSFNKDKLEKVNFEFNSEVKIKLKSEQEYKRYNVGYSNKGTKEILTNNAFNVRHLGSNEKLLIIYDNIEQIELEGENWTKLLSNIDKKITENQAVQCIFSNGDEELNLVFEKTEPALQIKKNDYKHDFQDEIVDTNISAIEKSTHESSEEIRINNERSYAKDYKIKFKKYSKVFSLKDILFIESFNPI